MKNVSFVPIAGMEENKKRNVKKEVFRKNSKYLLFFIERSGTLCLENFLNSVHKKKGVSNGICRDI